MRRVNRDDVSPPEYLSSPEASARRQAFLDYLAMEPGHRAQRRAPDRNLPDPDDPTITRALAELFLGKCAFCESVDFTSIYRFRPTSDADTGEAGSHYLHYGWLADAWQNLFPICRACRPRKRNFFPVYNKSLPVPTVEEYQAYVELGNGVWPGYPLRESPKLIDPCGTKNLEKHIFPQMDGRVIAHSERGAVTIQHFRLNRPALVDQRRRAFLEYQDRDTPVGVHEPYAGLWHMLVKFLAKNPSIAARLDEEKSARLLARAEAKARAAPRLIGVKVQDFKALEQIELAIPYDPSKKLAQVVLILGENAAGKSSILEAIALGLMSDAARRSLDEDPAKYLLDPALMGAPNFERKGEAQVTLTFDDHTTRTLTITSAGFSVDGVEAQQPVYAYGAYRHYRDNTRIWSSHRPVVSLFRSDNLLSNPEEWLLSISEVQLEEVVRALRFVFGAAQTFDVIKVIKNEEGQKVRCVVCTQLADGREIQTPLDSVSSGFRTVLALCCDVMRWAMDKRRDRNFTTLEAARGVVLIDEIEAHLHPRWKIQIVDGLRKAMPFMTFVITTHDPLCLRGLKQDEVKVLHRTTGFSHDTELPVQVETLTDLPKVEALTIEQLLTSDLFGLTSVDDARAEEILAQMADALSARVPDKRAVMALREKLLVEVGKDMRKVLPIGLGAAGRLIQEALADYLVERRAAPTDRRHALRQETRVKIKQYLEQ